MRKYIIITILSAFVGGVTALIINSYITEDKDENSAYFLKGQAPKYFNKKICLLSAGQSNIDGRCAYEDMPSYLSNAMPIDSCHYVKNNEDGKFSALNIKDKWAFDLVTYYDIIKLAHTELYVIKWTKGGTSIDPKGDKKEHWTADYEKIAKTDTSLLKRFETEIRNSVGDNSGFEIRALLWHQGEGDRANLGTGCADRYYENLKHLISYIRGITNNANLPVITGTISHKSAQYDKKIEDAQKRLADEDPNFYLIDMSGATLLDKYHFDAKSSEYFGNACYNKLIEAGVIKGEKLSIKEPWK